MKLALPALCYLLSFSSPGTAQEDLCEAVLCPVGTQCVASESGLSGTIRPRCIPVTCDAERACRFNEECVPMEVACAENVTACPQFECVEIEVDCAAVTCEEGSECHPKKGTCVPVSCDATNACPVDWSCEPKEKECRKENVPCPQFKCLPPPCETTCGLPVAPGTRFTDDGENYCNRCQCTRRGEKRCRDEVCELDEELSVCPTPSDEE